MIPPYAFAVDQAVVELFSRCSKRERDELLRIFHSLAAFPHQRGERVGKSPEGREFQVKQFGRWIVTFWPDDPVLEVRVIALERRVPA